MQMQQRALGCGGSPAYGPIRRDANIWQAENITSEYAWTDPEVTGYIDYYRESITGGGTYKIN
jgi:hypothetical protein